MVPPQINEEEPLPLRGCREEARAAGERCPGTDKKNGITLLSEASLNHAAVCREEGR